MEIEKKKKILKFVFLWLLLIKTTFDRVQGGKHPRFEGSMSEGGERLGAFVSTTISCADPETGLLASSLVLGTSGKSMVRHGMVKLLIASRELTSFFSRNSPRSVTTFHILLCLQ